MRERREEQRQVNQRVQEEAARPAAELSPAREAAKKICLARYQQFGCAGQASKIKAIPLDKMAERYKKGELNQIVK